jgi:uncharacterized protein
MAKSKTKELILIFLVVFIIVAVAYIALNQRQRMPKGFTVEGKNYSISAYAYTNQQREQGLMNSTVTSNTFMLFYFPELGIYPFWMKNTYSPLDILWIDYNYSANKGTIVYIANATPCSSYNALQSSCIIYTPNSYANYVLESQQGFASRNNIKNGTVVKFIYK